MDVNITIRPKRKGFIWTSFLFCAAEFIIGLVIIILAIFNLSSKKRNIDVPIISKWRLLMAQLIGLSAGLILVATLGMWIVTKARQKNKVSASFIIVVHILAFLGSLYFVASFYELDVRPDMSAEEIFIYTNKSIAEGIIDNEDPKWVPTWLDFIQEASENCCGVLTFHDWDSFWFPLRNQVPKSCCLKTRKDCQPNFDKLIYPDLPARNIKLEDGCHSDIKKRIKELVTEARKCSIALAIILGLSLILLCALYVVVFFLKKSPITDDDWDEDDDSSVYQPTVAPAQQKSSRAIKFRPEEQNWQNLEFYRVKTKKRRPRFFFGQKPSNPVPENQRSGAGLVNPLGATNSAGIASSSGLLGIPIAQLQRSPSPPPPLPDSLNPTQAQPAPPSPTVPQLPQLPPQVQYKMEPPQTDQPDSSALDSDNDPENPERKHRRHHIRGFSRRRHHRKHRDGSGSNPDDENQDNNPDNA